MLIWFIWRVVWVLYTYLLEANKVRLTMIYEINYELIPCLNKSSIAYSEGVSFVRTKTCTLLPSSLWLSLLNPSPSNIPSLQV